MLADDLIYPESVKVYFRREQTLHFLQGNGKLLLYVWHQIKLNWNFKVFNIYGKPVLFLSL